MAIEKPNKINLHIIPQKGIMVIWVSFCMFAHIEQLPIITDLVLGVCEEIALALRAIRNFNPTAVGTV